MESVLKQGTFDELNGSGFSAKLKNWSVGFSNSLTLTNSNTITSTESLGYVAPFSESNSCIESNIVADLNQANIMTDESATLSFVNKEFYVDPTTPDGLKIEACSDTDCVKS